MPPQANSYTKVNRMILEGGNAHTRSMSLRKPENQFVLKNVHLRGDSADTSLTPQMSAPYADYVGRQQTFLELLVRDDRLRCLSFEDYVWQGKPMKELKVQFSRIHPVTKKPVEVTTGYYFSPENGWICCGLQDYPVRVGIT